MMNGQGEVTGAPGPPLAMPLQGTEIVEGDRGRIGGGRGTGGGGWEGGKQDSQVGRNWEKLRKMLFLYCIKQFSVEI